MSTYAACNVNQHDRFVWGPRWPREEDTVTGGARGLSCCRDGEFHKETVRAHPGPMAPHVAVVCQPVKTSDWPSGSSLPI